ncbi:MAG TPA: aldo/keto reductase [Chthoniobacteraceae bacterium]|nr:aldo/keto reductase [Chthoniobacteraceae bacterium]
MTHTRLGNTGLKVSRLCLGTMTYGSSKWRKWVLDEAESRPFIEKALSVGINFFDTADMYSNGASEEVLGRAIKDMVPDREDVVIATKCYNGTHDKKLNRWGLSRKHIMAACDASLKRLGMDYIDLYQIHRFDYETPMLETLEALHDLVKAGKVRYIGASSMHAWQFAKYLYLADLHGLTRFVTMQDHYNLVYREEEREMLPLCLEEKIGVIPWSPLARGFLAGNRAKAGGGETTRAQSDDFAAHLYYGESDFAVAERNLEVAKRLGVKPMQSALAWVLSNQAVTAPIIGASKPGHIEDAIVALDIHFTPDDKKALEELYQPHKTLGFE